MIEYSARENLVFFKRQVSQLFRERYLLKNYGGD